MTRHMIGKDRRTVGRSHATDFVQILDDDRQPRQPDRPDSLAGQPGRSRARMGLAQRRQRVDRRVHLGDAGKRRGDRVGGRDLPLAEKDDDVTCIQAAKFIHGVLFREAGC